jgi:hypothetical protein
MIEKLSTLKRARLYAFKKKMLQRIESRNDGSPWYSFMGPMLPWKKWIVAAAPQIALIPQSNTRYFPEYKTPEEVKRMKLKKMKVGKKSSFRSSEDACP